MKKIKKIKRAKLVDDKRWTPVRRGSIYCSPACGGDCTFDAYQVALKNAAKLAECLGPDWRGDVWENLGWHYRALSACKRIKVNPNHWGGKNPESYSAFLGAPDFPGGKWAVSGKTPEEAVKLVIAYAKKDVGAYVDLITGL